MTFTEQQIQSLAPNSAAYAAGKKLSGKSNWQNTARSDRALWGAIKGSGSSPYLCQIDLRALAYKCTCPSRQFPCKHAIGLMLLFSNDAGAFVSESEPEWVTGWIDKRDVKEKPKEVPAKERTPEEQQQLDKSREKTQQNRLASVQAGAAELELWLQDVARMGLLELPNKNPTEFFKVAARMVDAKAPGLAGMVKSYATLSYHDENQWHYEALSTTARLFLLVNAIKNFDSLAPVWQQTVRMLAGWSQSTKELLADDNADLVDDEWLIAGQETDTSDDDITIQRNWVLGCHSKRQGLILNFATRFSPIENSFVPGTVVNGQMAFFPAVWPQRCAFKIQRGVINELKQFPEMYPSIDAVHTFRARQLAVFPWLNEFIFVLANARLMKFKERWIISDTFNSFYLVSPFFPDEKIMQGVAVTGHRAFDMAILLRNGFAFPLGVFVENEYKLL